MCRVFVKENLVRNRMSERVSLPRERFWDIQVPKIDSQTRRLLCPSRPASVPLRHTIASSALASQHSLKWLDGVLDAYAASPLALAHDGYATSGARLLGTTSLRFALHGWQRMNGYLSWRSYPYSYLIPLNSNGFCCLIKPKLFGRKHKLCPDRNSLQPYAFAVYNLFRAEQNSSKRILYCYPAQKELRPDMFPFRSKDYLNS